jgi:hypothetical protein
MAADTFACISQYVALATGDCDVLADGVVVGRLALGHHEDRTPTHGYAAKREAAMAIASTPCSPLPATTWALGYNEDRTPILRPTESLAQALERSC